MDPVSALRRIAFLLERSQAPTYRVKAFRTAAKVLLEHTHELEDRIRAGTLSELPGIGAVTGTVIAEAAAGRPAGLPGRTRGERWRGDTARRAGPGAAGGAGR